MGLRSPGGRKTRGPETLLRRIPGAQGPAENVTSRIWQASCTALDSAQQSANNQVPAMKGSEPLLPEVLVGQLASESEEGAEARGA